MSDSYLLAYGHQITLSRNFGTGSVFVIQSATWKPELITTAKAGILFYYLDGDKLVFPIGLYFLLSEEGVPVLRITGRDNKGNLRPENGEIHVTDDFFHNPEFNITIYETIDRWEVLLSYRHRFSYPKASPPTRSAVSIRYDYLSSASSPLAELLVITHHDSLARMVLPSTEVRPIHQQLEEEPISHSVPTTHATCCDRRNLVELPGRKKSSNLGFEYAEHGYLGDSITLSLANGKTSPAKDFPFKLENGLSLTYGQINGLAGDFYGTSLPISDGKTRPDSLHRFREAYATLAGVTQRQPKEALNLLRLLSREVTAVNEALKNHEDPSKVYASLPDQTKEFIRITLHRPAGQPGYLGLARINWDHFGVDALKAYRAGHEVALLEASEGSEGNLEKAYTMNAFADHFLEDLFAAGHVRTPRRLLHRSGAGFSADLCAKYMHDEDNAIGLQAQNKATKDSWTMYGDKRLLDEVNKDNLERCRSALQASVDEVYNVFKGQKIPDPPDYQALTHVCDLDAVRGEQVLKHLFTFQNERRTVITNRREFTPKKDWWFATTAIECWNSGWWEYPITIDGPKKKLLGSGNDGDRSGQGQEELLRLEEVNSDGDKKPSGPDNKKQLMQDNEKLLN